jgi:hypothetical protein
MKSARELLGKVPAVRSSGYWIVADDVPVAWLELVAEHAREEMQAECIEACHQEYRDDGTAQRIEALIRALPVKPATPETP